jgi:hypothetical protein
MRRCNAFDLALDLVTLTAGGLPAECRAGGHPGRNARDQTTAANTTDQGTRQQ